MRALLGPEVYPVNRLDRQTSGVIVMGLSKEGARELSAAFAERRVEKTYEAVVRGWPPLEAGQEMVIDRVLKDKPALTRIEVLARAELQEQLGRYPTTRLARVRMRPKTGVTHQLRRHMKGWGYPIVGDRRHGDSQLNPAFYARFGVKRLLLHSCGLTFPFGGESITAEAEWNGRALGLLQYLGLALPRQGREG
jgi:tRNA pseudouridine65 synthase